MYGDLGVGPLGVNLHTGCLVALAAFLWEYAKPWLRARFPNLPLPDKLPVGPQVVGSPGPVLLNAPEHEAIVKELADDIVKRAYDAARARLTR